MVGETGVEPIFLAGGCMRTSQNAVPRPLAVIWWTSRESNPVSLLARQMCSRYHYKPMGKNLMTVTGHELPRHFPTRQRQEIAKDRSLSRQSLCREVSQEPLTALMILRAHTANLDPTARIERATSAFGERRSCSIELRGETWSGRRESNPRQWTGRPLFYH